MRVVRAAGGIRVVMCARCWCRFGYQPGRSEQLIVGGWVRLPLCPACDRLSEVMR